MTRLRDGHPWSVFDPADTPLLVELVGSDFTDAYQRYELAGLATDKLDIAIVWKAIFDGQRETGTPFLCFQDNINGMVSVVLTIVMLLNVIVLS